MAEHAHRLMSVDEFLRWDDGTDTRYELEDGVVTAMAPPSNAHATVVVNAAVRLANGLAGRGVCRVQSETGIRVSEQTWWQADIAVACGPITPGHEIADPVLIVEVLSPETRAHDLGRKLDDYKLLPSVREVWMVDSERRWTQVWWRGEDGVWTGRDHVGTATFASGLLDATVALEDLYRDSGL
jgi:Uma2 family endonuclease